MSNAADEPIRVVCIDYATQNQQKSVLVELEEPALFKLCGTSRQVQLPKGAILSVPESTFQSEGIRS